MKCCQRLDDGNGDLGLQYDVSDDCNRIAAIQLIFEFDISDDYFIKCPSYVELTDRVNDIIAPSIQCTSKNSVSVDGDCVPELQIDGKSSKNIVEVLLISTSSNTCFMKFGCLNKLSSKSSCHERILTQMKGLLHRRSKILPHRPSLRYY